MKLCLKTTLLLICLLLPMINQAQISQNTFIKKFHCSNDLSGPAGLYYNSFVPTSDGGFIRYMTGIDAKGPNTGFDVVLHKYDQDFNFISPLAVIGGSNTDGFTYAFQMRNKKILFVGASGSGDMDVSFNTKNVTTAGSVSNYWLHLMNENGSTLAGTILYDSTTSLLYDKLQAINLQNGNILFAGRIGGSGSTDFARVDSVPQYSDVFIFCYDSLLNLQWKQFFVGDSAIEKVSVCETENSGFAVSLRTPSSGVYYNDTNARGGYDIILKTFDANGTEKKSFRYGGSGTEYASNILYDKNNATFYLVMNTFSSDYDCDNGTNLNAPMVSPMVNILKLDTNGTILKKKGYGCFNLQYESYVFENYTAQFINNRLFIISMVDGTSGDLGPPIDTNLNIDVWCIQLDTALELIANDRFGGSYDDRIYPYNHITSNNDICILGLTGTKISFTPNPMDFFGCSNNGLATLYYAVLGSAPVGVKDITKAHSTFKIYPNPTFGDFTIESPDGNIAEIKIYNLQGKLIPIEKFGTNQLFHVRIPSAVSGLYLVEIIDEPHQSHFQKILVR